MIIQAIRAYPFAPAGNPYGFVAAGAGTQVTSSGNLNVPYPAGLLAGDILIIFVNASYASGNESVTTPSGWNLIGTPPNNGAGTMYAFWKVATGTETGTQAVAHGAPGAGNDHFSGVMVAYGGCNQSTPIVDPQTATGSANAMSYTSVSLSAANQIKIDAGIGNSNTGTVGTPTGFASRVVYNGASTRTGIGVADKTFSSSGATGAETANQSSSSFWSTYAFGLLAA